MSAIGLWAAQKGVVSSLKAAAGVTSLVSGVYDEVPQGQTYPYLAVSQGREVPDNTFGLDGHAVEIELVACTQDGSPTAATSGSAGYKKGLAIIEAAVARLSDTAVTVEGHTVVSVHHTAVETSRDEDGVTRYVTAKMMLWLEDA